MGCSKAGRAPEDRWGSSSAMLALPAVSLTNLSRPRTAIPLIWAMGSRASGRRARVCYRGSTGLDAGSGRGRGRLQVKGKAWAVMVALSTAGGAGWSSTPGGDTVSASRYEDLVALFKEWRQFQGPALRDGVPDYTPAAMAEQKRRLPELQRRLQALDRRGWPVAQQVDWHLVRAEMNGLDFEHR